MPCKTEEPSPLQQEGREAAELTMYLFKEIGATPDPHTIAMSKEYFPHTQDVHIAVRKLCSALRDLREVSPAEFERVVYNARSKESRRMANWWERHQEMDERRAAAEKASEDMNALADIAMSKLTSAEIGALKKRWGALQ